MRQICELTHQLAQREPTLMDAGRRYAVLVPLVEVDGQLHLLYEVRSSRMRRQPGEVCFPGGRIDHGESPEACALRETFEELGVPREDVRILGHLDFLAHRANFILYPILAQIDETWIGKLSLSPAEVEETFLVPVEHLLNNPPQEYTYDLEVKVDDTFPYDLVGIPETYHWQTGAENVPVYPWQGHTIWGLTARITRNLMGLMGGRKNGN